MSYLNDFLRGTDIHKAVRTAENRLAEVEFDAIAVRGTSGLLIGAPLAVRLGKNLLVVRKKAAQSHSSYPVEGMLKFKQPKVLIVDDFCETGNTVYQIHRKIMTHCIEPTIVGVYFYNSSCDGISESFTLKGLDIPLYRPRRKDR